MDCNGMAVAWSVLAGGLSVFLGLTGVGVAKYLSGKGKGASR